MYSGGWHGRSIPRHTYRSCVYSGGWRGRSLPRHAHRDPVCTAQAGVAGHFLDTRMEILVNSRGWHGRSLPRYTHGFCVYSKGWRGRSLPRHAHRDPACTVEAGVAGSGQLQGECPSRGMLTVAPRIFSQQRVQKNF